MSKAPKTIPDATKREAKKYGIRLTTETGRRRSEAALKGGMIKQEKEKADRRRKEKKVSTSVKKEAKKYGIRLTTETGRRRSEAVLKGMIKQEKRRRSKRAR